MADDVDDDLLTVIALARFSHDFDDAAPRLSSRAWTLAVERASHHGIRPAEALDRIEWE